MPTVTYTPIANVTLGSNTTSVTFSSISQAYRDLVLITNIVSAGTYTSFLYRINSDSGGNYNGMWGTADGTFIGSNSTNGGLFWSGVAVNGTLHNVTHILDYSATDKQKSILSRINKFDSEGNSTGLTTNRWASNSAINSIEIYSSGTYSNPFGVGSTFALYGIAA